MNVTRLDPRAGKKLTKRQRMVHTFIIQHIEDHGYPPTIREIGDHMGIKSTNGVNDHLKALERKGYLERQDAKSRALRPVCDADGQPFEEASSSPSDGGEFDEPTTSVPVVGRIAAGRPIPAIEHAEEILRISEGMLGGSRRAGDPVFALVVNGDSMIEDGIFDGDYIFVRSQHDAPDGEIVAAMVDGEATVKRIYREGDRVRLQPSNASMEPIYIHSHEARETAILGRVVGVFRKI